MRKIQSYLARNALGCMLAVLALAAHLVFPERAWAQYLAVGLGPVQGAVASFDLNEAMKVVFEDTLDTNVVSDSELMDLFEKDTDVQTETGSDGRYVEAAHMFGLPAGYGYRNESDPVPVPRGPTIRNSRVNLKKSMGSVSITGTAFDRVKQGKAAFTTWAKQQFPSLVKRMTNEKDRIMLGYGYGIKAQVASIVGSTITVKNAAGVAGLSLAILQFLAGEDVAFSSTVDGAAFRANAAGGHNVVATDCNLKTGVITLSEIPVGLLVDDYIFSCDETAVSSLDADDVRREFMGLLGHVDDGSIVLDYFNIARDEFFAWQGIVVDLTGAPYNGELTEEGLMEGDRQGRLFGGAKIDVLVVSYDGQMQFWRDLRKDRVINDPRAWTGGSKGLKMVLGDRLVDVRGARKLPKEVAFGLTRGTFTRYTNGKFMWVDRTGSMWQPVIVNGRTYDAFRAYGRDYDEYFCREPNQNIRFSLG